MLAARNFLMTGVAKALPKGSIDFPGSTYVQVNSTAAIGFGTSDYTAEAWIYPYSWSASQIIIGAASGTWSLRLGSGYGQYLNGLQITLSQQADFDRCSYTFSEFIWYHVAVTRQSGTVRFFVNGTNISNLSTGNSSYNWSDESTLAIGTGGMSASNENYRGRISNARVVKGTALYTSNFTVPSTPLTAVSGTSLLIAQSPATIGDLSPNSWTTSVPTGSAAASSLSPFA